MSMWPRAWSDESVSVNINAFTLSNVGGVTQPLSVLIPATNNSEIKKHKTSVVSLTCENKSQVAHTPAGTHFWGGRRLTEVNPCYGWRELGEARMEGGEENQETALSFTESGGVIRGVVWKGEFNWLTKEERELRERPERWEGEGGERHEVPEERKERKKGGNVTCISMKLHPSSPLLPWWLFFLNREKSLLLLSISDGTSGREEGFLFDAKPAASTPTWK